MLFPTSYLVSSFLLPEGRAGTPWEPEQQYIFCSPYNNNNNNNNNNNKQVKEAR